MGGNGADTLIGGQGDDTFVYRGTSEAAAGEIVDGVAGTDTVLVVGSTTFNSTVAFNNIDALSIAAGQDATISTAQLATLPTVSGGSGSTLTVNVTSGATYTLPSSQGYSGVAVRVVGGAGDEFITGWTGNESIQGLGGNDTLVGGTGNGTLSGGVGTDSVIGDTGNDVFVFGGTSEVSAGETVDGTSGTDTLLVTASTDLTGLVMANIDGVSIASGQTATFTGAQVTGQLWTVTGVAGGLEEVLAVNATVALGETINLSTFTTVTNASIALNGTFGNDVLTGSVGSDTLTGGGGMDMMHGWDGNDTFVFNNGGEILAGESADGGNGTDTIRVAGSTSFATMSFLNIEAVSLADGTTATFTGGQITGQSWAVTGTAGGVVETVVVNAAAAATVDLSGITSVTNAAFQLNGSTGDEVLTGTSGTDTLTGGLGSDALSGGDGNDTFVYNGTPDAGATETVNGGNGTDTVRLESSTNLTSVAFTNVEAFSLADGAALTLTPAQVAGQTWAINGTAGGGTEALNVTAATGGSASLASLTGLANLSINLNGALGAETLTGSSAADTISGLAGTDSVLGGGGADSLFAGDDADTLVGGTGSDTLSGGAGSDRFVFATGDASSTTLGSLEVITDFVAADDEIALGVTGSGANTVITAAAVDYAAALTAATATITAGTQDIVVTEAGANTFVFADTNGDNVLDTVIQLTGTGLGLASGDFVA